MKSRVGAVLQRIDNCVTSNCSQRDQRGTRRGSRKHRARRAQSRTRDTGRPPSKVARAILLCRTLCLHFIFFQTFSIVLLLVVFVNVHLWYPSPREMEKGREVLPCSHHPSIRIEFRSSIHRDIRHRQVHRGSPDRGSQGSKREQEAVLCSCQCRQ